MAKETQLIDSHVSLEQCKKAVSALLEHEAKKIQEEEERELLPNNEKHVWLVLAVKKMQPGHRIKPHKIPIKHPLVDPRTSSVCLITKDPQREYKDLLEAQGIKFISRVVGLEKLKGKFRPYEARRMLLKENDLFLADDRIIPLLPKLLGSKWFNAKKQPIPVSLTRKDVKAELERAITSTYMNQNQGTCTSVKIGITTQTAAQILSNIQVALPEIVKHIKDGWDNIQSLHIKTSNSVSLPIWSCSLDEEGRFAVTSSKGQAEDVKMDGDESEEERVPAKKTEKDTASASKKKKKRASGDEEGEDEKAPEAPRKKAKTSQDTAESTTKHKSKSKTSDASTPAKPTPTSKKPISTAGPTAPVTASPTPADATSKKKMKRTELDAPPAPAVELVEESKKKKDSKDAKKKSKTTNEKPAEVATIESVDLASTSTKPKPKKDKASVTEDTEPPDSSASGVPAKSEKKAKKSKDDSSKLSATTTPTSADSPTPKKKIEVPSSKAAKPPTPSLTADELKQKRKDSRVGDKKKDKVLSAKGGSAGAKSAKASLLGKKPGKN